MSKNVPCCNADRLYSPWVQIIGKGTFAAPVVLVQLEHIGNQLKSVRAEVWVLELATPKCLL